MDDITATGAFSANDELYMRRALELAERGRGRVNPNPLVGCVLVVDDLIVGEGWHARAGEAHAEVVALHEAGPGAEGATAYVTLEPCDHHGRTPPCTEALIGAGVQRVVVASLDPDPRVNGAGVQRLRQAGLVVDTGVLQDEANLQNEVFRTNRMLGRPFVLYKTAMSLDGKVAVRGGPARWITGEAARTKVHRWRDEYDAIGVGIGTVLMDDPSLTTRIPESPRSTLSGVTVEPSGGTAGTPPGRTPVRVIFDSDLRTPPNARLFETGPDGADARVIVVAGENVLQRNPDATPLLRQLLNRGADVIFAQEREGRPDLKAALRELLQRGVTSLLLEGGGELAAAFLEAELIDRVAWFVAPTLIGGAGVPGPLGGTGAASMDDAVSLPDLEVQVVGADLLLTGHPDYPVVLVADEPTEHEHRTEEAAEAGSREEDARRSTAAPAGRRVT